ncbi:hypothetical protein [Hydrogenimonas sp.]
MKVTLACRSILLEKSLRKFLRNYLSHDSEADIVITDYLKQGEKPILRIGTDVEADLKKPFSHSQLMIRLEEKLERHAQKEKIHNFCKTDESENSLEEKIEILTRNFATELIQTIKEHYKNER